MPATTRPARRPLQDGAPRSAHQRKPVARHATGALVAPRRCPHCFGSLRHLVPVPAKALEAATVVAWHTLDRRPATSAQVADSMTTRRHRMTQSQAGDHLRNAVACKLVTYSRMTLPAGGAQRLYRATPALVAYIEQDSLATSLADTLGYAIQGANRLTSSVRGTLAGIARDAGQATHLYPHP